MAQLSQWRKRDEPDAKSKECRFLEQAIAVFLTKLFDKKRYRFDELLQLCSADTAFVRDLYFEYIQNSYLTDNNQLDVTNKFAAAIPFLIDGTAAPVIFDNEQQRALDSFLQTSVCKIDVTLAQHQQCLDITTRATLLRRLLLQLIQVELETSASVSATNTLAQTAVGLLDVISALLLRFLLLLIQAQLETSVLVSATITQAQMAADLLDKISAVLACSIAVPPTTEQQNQHAQCLQEVYEKLSSVDAEILKKPLIQQLSLLVQYTEDVLQKTTVFKELCNEKEQQQTWTIEAFIQAVQHYTDQQGRLLKYPADHLDRFDTVLARLTQMKRPQSCEQRITQLQLLVCRYLNTGPRASASNSQFFQPDAAESNRELAFKVNEQGAANVARICQQHQLPLIHISTDYVFAGIDAQSASEDDATQPLNVYGQSKLAGESAVLDENAEATIVRTSAIFSAHGHNFAKTILRLAEAKRSINVITDQITCPTAATHLADVILTMLTAKTRGGVYHYCDGPAVSWFDFANAIIAEAKQQNRCQQVTVIPITSNEYKTSARRPQHSVLNCEKIHNDFQISQQHWQTTLASLIEQVCNYDG